MSLKRHNFFAAADAVINNLLKVGYKGKNSAIHMIMWDHFTVLKEKANFFLFSKGILQKSVEKY